MVAVAYNFSIMVAGIRMIMSFRMALERALNSRKKQGRMGRKGVLLNGTECQGVRGHYHSLVVFHPDTG